MDVAARLLLTYLVHSTLLLGGAWAACRRLGERRLALQEALVRAALAGGFATASLQVGLGLVPLGGALRLPQASVVEPWSTPAAAPAVAPRPAAAASPARTLAAGDVRTTAAAGSAAAETAARGWPTRIVIVPAEPTWAERAPLAVRRAAAGYWREALAAAWAALAAAALVRLGVAARRLARLLRNRETLASSPLVPEVEAVGEALGLRRPVRISTAPRLSVPLATGVLRPEVCLPTRAIVELGAEEQVALCAHELAHVARRDPAWVLAARVVESLAPLQPLNTWARRRLQDVAECLSDDLAVSVSARPLGLARSLVDVASWTLDDPALLPVAASGALSARSRLGLRVERLMDPVRRLERPRRLLLPAAAAAVLATALVTPVVSVSASEPQAPPTPAAAPAPSARPAPAARPAPVARPAPEHRRESASSHEADERIEELSRTIAERARLHEAEMKKLEAQLEAAVARMRPNEAEMKRLTAEMETAARDMASALAEEAGKGDDARGASREAARRMAELRAELQRSVAGIRVPAEEMRALSEQARAVAEQVRPTPSELAELRRLSEQVARDSMPVAEDLARQARVHAEVARSHARHMSEETREAMRRAAEEMRLAVDEMRRAMDTMRSEPFHRHAPEPSPAPEARPAPRPEAMPAPTPRPEPERP